MDEVVGQYRLVKVLGGGGMATVYRGEHVAGIGMVAAVKKLHPHLALDAQLRARLKVEAQALARLKHPNVVQLLDFVDEGDDCALITELVEGRTLREVLHNDGIHPVPVPYAVRLARQILLGVGHAHSKGCLHRDIKPGNVMVTAEHQVKVLDFGIASLLDTERLTRTGISIGTPVYMAPEQLDSMDGLDERADIYALGVTLWELLAGPGARRIGQKGWRLGPEQLAMLVDRGVPQPLVDVLEGMVREDVGLRMASCEEALRALDWVAEDSLAEPDPDPDRTQPMRRPAGMGAQALGPPSSLTPAGPPSLTPAGPPSLGSAPGAAPGPPIPVAHSGPRAGILASRSAPGAAPGPPIPVAHSGPRAGIPASRSGAGIPPSRSGPATGIPPAYSGPVPGSRPAPPRRAIEDAPTRPLVREPSALDEDSRPTVADLPGPSARRRPAPLSRPTPAGLAPAGLAPSALAPPTDPEPTRRKRARAGQQRRRKLLRGLLGAAVGLAVLGVGALAVVVLRQPVAPAADPEVHALLAALPGVVVFPPGPFEYGEPGRTVTLSTFGLDATEVTLGDWRSFAASDLGGDDLTARYAERGLAASARLAQPVQAVRWNEAMTYCRWRARDWLLPAGYESRLPTDAEWERAARGPGGQARPFPTGDRFLPGLRTVAGNALPDAGSTDGDATGEGVRDLLGSVEEWVLDSPPPDRIGTPSDARRDPARADRHSTVRAVRGGSQLGGGVEPGRYASGARRWVESVQTETARGFRCAVGPAVGP